MATTSPDALAEPVSASSSAPSDATAAATPTPTPAVCTSSPTTTTTTAPTNTTTTTTTDPSPKPIHTLVVDTGPLIKNDPPLSTLLAQAEQVVTIPAVLDEVRDPATRARVDTTLRPFLTLRNPRPASVKFVSDFARKTGDLEVLSRPDLHLLALTYELECERNGGDWRLRATPTQRGVNGKSPAAIAAEAAAAAASATVSEAEKATDKAAADSVADGEGVSEKEKEAAGVADKPTTQEETDPESQPEPQAEQQPETTTEEAQQPIAGLEDKVADLSLEETAEKLKLDGVDVEDEEEEEGENDEDDDDDDGGEWITPSNLKKHQAKEATGGVPAQPIQARLQAALLTSDFAMQNVALRINLNLLSPSSSGGAPTRITRVKTWVLRCHGCFAVTRQMSKQFCPSCGQATLTRTSCSTDAATGQFRLHLKKNFQYNKRGNVYSVPKPVHGSASGKMTDKSGGGGAQGWGRDLILSEDQREYTKQAEEQKRARVRDMMDEDYLPNLLTGARTGGQGRIRVGAGRNVNVKKRR